MAVYDRITPAGKRFFAEIEKLRRTEVQVGYQAGAAYSNGEGSAVDITEVVMWNEMGTSKSPSRPFMRKSVDNNASTVNKMCKMQLALLASGSASAHTVLQNIGVMQKGLIQNEISRGGFAANAPATIRKKKSAKPLIDSSLMRQSVNFKITGKGGGK